MNKKRRYTPLNEICSEHDAVFLDTCAMDFKFEKNKERLFNQSYYSERLGEFFERNPNAYVTEGVFDECLRGINNNHFSESYGKTHLANCLQNLQGVLKDRIFEFPEDISNFKLDILSSHLNRFEGYPYNLSEVDRDILGQAIISGLDVGKTALITNDTHIILTYEKSFLPYLSSPMIREGKHLPEFLKQFDSDDARLKIYCNHNRLKGSVDNYSLIR